jgi:hypothetical protein
VCRGRETSGEPLDLRRSVALFVRRAHEPAGEVDRVAGWPGGDLGNCLRRPAPPVSFEWLRGGWLGGGSRAAKAATARQPAPARSRG